MHAGTKVRAHMRFDAHEYIYIFFRRAISNKVDFIEGDETAL